MAGATGADHGRRLFAAGQGSEFHQAQGQMGIVVQAQGGDKALGQPVQHRQTFALFQPGNLGLAEAHTRGQIGLAHAHTTAQAAQENAKFDCRSWLIGHGGEL